MKSLDRINQEALILFAEKGYYGTSLSMIANAVGIRKSSIYAHYNSKDELFIAVVQFVAGLYKAKLEQFFAVLKEVDHPVEHQLYHVLRWYMQLWVDKKNATKFWRRIGLFPPEHLENEIKRISAETVAQSFHKELADIFRKGVENGELRNVPSEKLVALFQILIDGILTAILLNDYQETTELIQDGWHHFWSGIKAADIRQTNTGEIKNV
ncbi:TetR/AcrR family transcriptional regulator [Mesobacillus boroniphilus]|uniref:TetR/AcrR family transcriptional regulator n=1 Tax=Mesobacillus boroniphilus TaxID=308892 RepID=A0A944CID7_9BACI|nr:TetR/AcrR family transcriptional regulator [Mesobacillus boroniphilus]MBS8263775.1 TetR/AcrR family transcriptional regulator [Mesobacillus boroniphilus]